jgi:hypothetical protein
VADAVEKIGAEGVVSVEEAKATETTLEVVEGMQFDRGYLSPYFVTEPERMECVHDDPFILLSERKIGVMKDLVPVLEHVVHPDARRSPRKSSGDLARALVPRRGDPAQRARHARTAARHHLAHRHATQQATDM